MGYISISVAVRFSHFRKPHRGHVERCVDIAGPRGDCASELFAERGQVILARPQKGWLWKILLKWG